MLDWYEPSDDQQPFTDHYMQQSEIVSTFSGPVILAEPMSATSAKCSLIKHVILDSVLLEALETKALRMANKTLLKGKGNQERDDSLNCDQPRH